MAIGTRKATVVKDGIVVRLAIEQSGPSNSYTAHPMVVSIQVAFTPTSRRRDSLRSGHSETSVVVVVQTPVTLCWAVATTSGLAIGRLIKGIWDFLTFSALSPYKIIAFAISLVFPTSTDKVLELRFG